MSYADLGLPRPSRRLFRLLRGPYTQRELSDTLQVDGGTIAAWEAGACRPRLPHLRQLLDHYLTWARRLKKDPLGLLTKPGRASAPGAPRNPPRGTPAAPSLTPAKSEAAEPAASLPLAPSLSSEGGPEKLS